MSGASAFAAACATRGTSLQRLQLVPAPAFPAPRLGLNVITYGAIDPLVLQHLQAIGVSLTLRCPVRSLGQAIAVLQAVAPFPSLQVVLLVETVDDYLVNDLASLLIDARQLVAIALGNELDLAGVSAADAHTWTQRSYTSLRVAGFVGDIYAPSIYCVQPDHLHDYAFPLWQHLPTDIVCDLHRYGDPDAGQDGYASRSDEIATIRNLVGPDRRVVISECGWPTRTGSDIQWALAAAVRDRTWAQQLGAIGWYYYQLQDGPGAGDISHYGLRRVDGTWKGLDGIFA